MQKMSIIDDQLCVRRVPPRVERVFRPGQFQLPILLWNAISTSICTL